jgi:hypothetical protein
MTLTFCKICHKNTDTCNHIKRESIIEDEITSIPWKEGKELRFNKKWAELPQSEYITGEMKENARVVFHYEEESQKLIRTILIGKRTFNTNIPYVITQIKS